MTRHPLSTAILAAALGMAGAATAQTVTSGATIVGPNGRTTVVDRAVTRGGGQLQGTVNVNRDDGRGFTRSFNQSRANGVVTRQGTVVTNRGQVFTRDAQRSCAGGACSGFSTVTGPNGRQWTRERNVRRVAPGQWQGQVTRTGPGGRQVTSQRWFQIRRGQ
ncbi:MAG: hypothetical protein AAF899_06625 [Pseudomonadota bacterium]